MRIARWIFAVAGIYGLLVLTPLFFLESRINREQPPPITPPDHFYGFVSVAFAFQFVFLVIATDPRRYRPLMLVSVIEKWPYAGLVTWLYALDRAPNAVFGFAMIDAALGALFLIAFYSTRDAPSRSV
jgi:hypothetical protein